MRVNECETAAGMAEEDSRAVAEGATAESGTHWKIWAAASAAQLGWGIASLRKGYSGHSNLMPLKAFAVASLFVGATASASLSALHFSGIHQVEDMMEVGANLRTSLGIRPRARDE